MLGNYSTNNFEKKEVTEKYIFDANIFDDIVKMKKWNEEMGSSQLHILFSFYIL